jgi:uncharacterized protein (DUF433 family)
MTTMAAPVSHISFDDQGRPLIEGTTMKVVELISGKIAYDWSAEELGRQYSHLTMAQIHAALAYYYDHQSVLDSEIDRIARDAATERAALPNSPLRERLRALGKLA